MLHDLPLELLHQILIQVLVHDLPIDTHGPMRTAEEDRQRKYRISSSKQCLQTISRTDLSLFAVSRAIRSIALPIFWKMNAFRLYARTPSGARISSRFLRLQQPSIRNLVRRLQMELSFGDTVISNWVETWCSQLVPVANLKGLDKMGGLIIDARVETKSGKPEAIMCRAIENRVLNDFMERARWRFPNLATKYIHIRLCMKKGWCTIHAPEGVVPVKKLNCTI